LGAVAVEPFDQGQPDTFPELGQEGEALASFLRTVDSPTLIGLDPVIYPACVTCGAAWMLRRHRGGTWAWSPDCRHTKASCKLVRGESP
jgi:hypothetical protein